MFLKKNDGLIVSIKLRQDQVIKKSLLKSDASIFTKIHSPDLSYLSGLDNNRNVFVRSFRPHGLICKDTCSL